MTNTWPGWENAGLIGEGSFGKVYRIKREEFGKVYEAALKVITIPTSQADVRTAFEEGMNEESVTNYFRSFVEDIVAEFALMSELKGNSNIVSYEDHMVVEHEDGIGWDILIRMELLTALPDYAAKHPLEEADVIRLGQNLAQALALCRKRGIVHRDIKPENIFVSRDGDFKLGDFGVARVAEKTVSAMSRKGTYNYMAPEVYKGEEYGYAADMYSVGLVLYRFLNDNRTPFLPPYPQPIQYSDKEKALNRRIGGESLPPPAHGSRKLQEVVLKACAFRPQERYGSADELREALEDVAPDWDDGNKSAAMPDETAEEGGFKSQQDEEILDKTVSVFSERASSNQKEPAEEAVQMKKGWIYALFGLIAVIGICIGVSMSKTRDASQPGEQDIGQAIASNQQLQSQEAEQQTMPEQTPELPEETPEILPEEVQEMPEVETDTTIRIGVLADTEVSRMAFQYLWEQYPTIDIEGKTYDIELVFSDLFEESEDYHENEELGRQYGETEAQRFIDAECDIVCDASQTTNLEISREMGPMLTEAGIAVLGTNEYEDDTYFRIDPNRGAWENLSEFMGPFAVWLSEGKQVMSTYGAIDAVENAGGIAIRLNTSQGEDDSVEDYEQFLMELGDSSQIGAIVLGAGQIYYEENLEKALQNLGYGTIPVITDSIWYCQDASEIGYTNVYYALEGYYWNTLGLKDTFGPEFRTWLDADVNRAAMYDESFSSEGDVGTVMERDYVAHDMFMTVLQALEMGGDVKQALWTGTFTGLTGTFRFKLDGEGCLSEYISYPVYHYESDSFVDFTMP